MYRLKWFRWKLTNFFLSITTESWQITSNAQNLSRLYCNSAPQIVVSVIELDVSTLARSSKMWTKRTKKQFNWRRWRRTWYVWKKTWVSFELRYKRTRTTRCKEMPKEIMDSKRILIAICAVSFIQCTWFSNGFGVVWRMYVVHMWPLNFLRSVCECVFFNYTWFPFQNDEQTWLFMSCRFFFSFLLFAQLFFTRHSFFKLYTFVPLCNTLPYAYYLTLYAYIYIDNRIYAEEHTNTSAACCVAFSSFLAVSISLLN